MISLRSLLEQCFLFGIWLHVAVDNLKCSFLLRNIILSYILDGSHPVPVSYTHLYLVAQTYPKGSAEFNNVFDIAVRMFPEDKLANLNAASAAIEREMCIRDSCQAIDAVTLDSILVSEVLILDSLLVVRCV